jgi:hypothetical protein
MEHGSGTSDSPLHTLIPLAGFKAILGIDDRENCLYFPSMRNTGRLILPGAAILKVFLGRIFWKLIFTD